MMKILIVAAACTASFWALPVQAQEIGQQEVMLSPSRASQSGRAQIAGYDPDIPAVGLIRTADFAVRSVTIEGDTRDKELRESEIRSMLESTIRIAADRGLELSFGSMSIENLTLDNFAIFTEGNVLGGSRPDTSRISFLVKVPLNDQSDLETVTKRMDDFQNAVRPVGRAQFAGKGPITLSIVKPDQYRTDIIGLVGRDSREVAAQVGDAFSVTITGLHKPVDWIRWGDLKVMLFLPYETTVVPK